MGKIAFKAYQFGDNPNPMEYDIIVNKAVSEHFAFLKNWSLKDLRKIYIKHCKNNFPIFVNKFQFRELFPLEKNNCDYLFNYVSAPSKF